MRGGRHPPVGGVGAAECVEGEDLDGGVVGAPRLVENGGEPCPVAIERRQQTLAEERLLAAAGGAVERVRRLERRARLRGPAERAQHAAEVHAGQRGQPHVAGRLGLLDRERERGGAGLVVAGLALRAPQAGQLVGLGLLEAEPPRRLGGAADVDDGVVEAVLDPRQLAEHCVAAHLQPRVVDALQPVLDLVARRGGADAVVGRDRGAGGEQPVRGLVPRLLQPLAAARGQLQRQRELAVV